MNFYFLWNRARRTTYPTRSPIAVEAIAPCSASIMSFIFTPTANICLLFSNMNCYINVVFFFSYGKEYELSLKRNGARKINCPEARNCPGKGISRQLQRPLLCKLHILVFKESSNPCLAFSRHQYGAPSCNFPFYFCKHALAFFSSV